MTFGRALTDSSRKCPTISEGKGACRLRQLIETNELLVSK
jgi:hypothetical protein